VRKCGTAVGENGKKSLLVANRGKKRFSIAEKRNLRDEQGVEIGWAKSPSYF